MTVKPLEEMTLNELREEGKNIGIIGVEHFDKKKPLILAINSIRSLQPKVTKFDPAPIPGVDNVSKDVKSYTSKKERTKAYHESQPKERFLIPLGIGEKLGAVETFLDNGYRLNIAKGVFVMLPRSVIDELMKAHNMTMEAGKEFSADRVDSKTGRPVSEQL
jgi:hypothetical protein